MIWHQSNAWKPLQYCHNDLRSRSRSGHQSSASKALHYGKAVKLTITNIQAYITSIIIFWYWNVAAVMHYISCVLLNIEHWTLFSCFFPYLGCMCMYVIFVTNPAVAAKSNRPLLFYYYYTKIYFSINILSRKLRTYEIRESALWKLT